MLALLAAAGLGAVQEQPGAADGEPRAEATGGKTATVAIVRIYGVTDLQNQALVVRAAQQIKELKPDLALFEIDTPGGPITCMTRIGEEIVNLAPIPTAAYVRPPDKGGMIGGAISAGAYISISCKKLYMHPGTVIGASAPVYMTPGGGTIPAKEKELSATRNKFRARAAQNGYPANLAEAMVDDSLEVFEIEIDGEKRYLTTAELKNLTATGANISIPSSPFIAAGKLLTMTDRQVAQTGMGRIVESREAIYADYGLESPVEVFITLTDQEKFATFWTSTGVSMVLLIIGIFGIMIEIKTPGFGVPGSVGIIAFSLLLFGHHLAGLTEMWEIGLIVVGIGLIAVEIFVIPGTFVSAILGVLCVFTGLVLALQDFPLPDIKEAPWQTSIFLESVGRVVLSFLGAALAFLAVGRFIQKAPVAGRLVHNAVIAGGAPAPDVAGDLVGRQGHSVTPLRPGGKIELDGQVLDVVAEGDYVAIGEPVEVLRVDGMRTVVGKIKK